MHVVNTAGTRTTLSNMLGTSRYLMLVALGWLFLVVMRGSEAGEAHHPFAVMLLFLKKNKNKKNQQRPCALYFGLCFRLPSYCKERKFLWHWRTRCVFRSCPKRKAKVTLAPDAFDSLTALCPSITCNPSLSAVQSGGQDRILWQHSGQAN